VSKVNCSDNREIAGPSDGTGVTGGTSRMSEYEIEDLLVMRSVLGAGL
jgi:hypothetical protein